MRMTITARDVAELLGISYTKTLALAKSGLIPSVRLGGRFLFHRKTLEQWLNEQSMQSVQLKGDLK